jgi:hypothetical protein
MKFISNENPYGKQLERLEVSKLVMVVKQIFSDGSTGLYAPRDGRHGIVSLTISM